MNVRNSIPFFMLVATLLVPFDSLHAQSDSKTEGSSAKQSEKKKPQSFTAGSGTFQFEAPGDWKKIKPKFDFYDAEFHIPQSEGDSKHGRITFSTVGGSIEQNLERWVGQFKVNSNDENAIDKTSQTIDGTKVHLIKISGTFKDSAGGPMGPKTDRENYLLYGAAIETGKDANVYIKAYGPKKTMTENRKHLKTLIENMKAIDG